MLDLHGRNPGVSGRLQVAQDGAQAIGSHGDISYRRDISRN